MQQIAIFDYVSGKIEIFTTDESIDAEDFIVDELGLSLNDVCYMSKPGIIPVVIHCDD